MGVTIKDTGPAMDKVNKLIKELKSKELKVGIFGKYGSKILMIATVNEFGTVITPKKARNLAIPLRDEAVGKSPTEFDDLFVLPGSDVLARDTGNGLEFYYYLTKKVEIPERSFMRAGFDKYEKKMRKYANELLREVLTFNMSVDLFYSSLGNYMASRIQEYLKDLSDPSKSPITMATTNKNNPLIQSGELMSKITYEVD